MCYLKKEHMMLTLRQQQNEPISIYVRNTKKKMFNLRASASYTKLHHTI